MALCKLCGRLPPSVKDTRRLDASATSLVVKLATSACVDPTPFCEGTVCKTCYFQLHRLIKLEHQYSKLRDEFVARMVATVPAISEHSAAASFTTSAAKSSMPRASGVPW